MEATVIKMQILLILDKIIPYLQNKLRIFKKKPAAKIFHFPTASGKTIVYL